MSKKSKNHKRQKSRLDNNTQESGVKGQSKIGNKFEAEIFKLQVELVKLQGWVKATNALGDGPWSGGAAFTVR